jgi:hypothetical protein
MPTNLVDAQIRMAGITETDARRRARDLFHRDNVRQISETGAAPFFFHGDAEHAQCAEFVPEISREVIVTIDGGRARRNLAGGEFRDRVAEHLDRVAQVKIEARTAGSDERHVGSECKERQRAPRAWRDAACVVRKTR